MALPSNYTPIFSQEYLAVFDSEFQAIGKLANVVHPTRQRLGFIGASYNVPRSGTLDMVPYTDYQADISPNPISSANVNVTAAPYVVKSYLGDLEQDQFVAQAMGLIANQQAVAVSRYVDEIIINGLLQATTNADITATSGMTVAKLKEASTTLGRQSAMGKQYVLMHVNNFSSLMDDVSFVNSLYTNDKPLMQSVGNYQGNFLGMNIITFGDVFHTYDGHNMALPITSGVRTCIAFTDLSILYGRQGDMMHGYMHHPTNFRQELATLLSIGSKPFDEKGIVKILCTEA